MFSKKNTGELLASIGEPWGNISDVFVSRDPAPVASMSSEHILKLINLDTATDTCVF